MSVLPDKDENYNNRMMNMTLCEMRHTSKRMLPISISSLYQIGKKIYIFRFLFGFVLSPLKISSFYCVDRERERERAIVSVLKPKNYIANTLAQNMATVN